MRSGNLLVLLLCSLWTPSVIGQGNGAVRLYNNGVVDHTQSSGIVQIYYNESWGNICNDESFDLNAASVICRQLSYEGASSFSSSADDTSYGTDLSPSILEDVVCSSDSYQVLLQCSVTSTYSSSCSTGTFSDVIVNCITSQTWDNPYSLQVRLQDGDFVTEGRAEVYCSGDWGTICDDFVSFSFTDVVCRQLGYTESTSYATGFRLGSSTQPVWLYPTTCSSQDVCVANCEECPSSELTICNYLDSIYISCTYIEDDADDAASTLDTCSTSANGSLITTIGASVGSSVGGIILFCLLICCCGVCSSKKRRRRRREVRVVVQQQQAPTTVVVQHKHQAGPQQAAPYPAHPPYSNAPPPYPSPY